MQRKLREARFHLNQLAQVSSRLFGEQEQFDYHLSAFLTAARSVTGVVGFKTWLSLQTVEERNLLEVMITARNDEVHHTGANYVIETERTPVYGTYVDSSSRGEVVCPPAIFMSGPPAVIHKPVRVFHVNSQQLEVVEACTRCVNLLERLLEDFSQGRLGKGSSER